MSAGHAQPLPGGNGGIRGRRWLGIAVSLLAAGMSASIASAQVAAEPADTRPSQVDLLVLLARPTGDPIDEVYGDHTGFAVRYAHRLGRRFGLAAELGQRSASGTTPLTRSDAELDVLHGAFTVRLHVGGDADAAWDPWFGIGLLYQDVEEEVRFPDGTASGADSATGPLAAFGLRWRGRSGWGIGGEIRYSQASISAEGGDDTDLDGLDVAAGLSYSF